MSHHYETGRVVESKRPLESRFVPEIYIAGMVGASSGYPELARYGMNSDVMVYDDATGELLRIESPNGEVLKDFTEDKRS